jgi:hypothetical protein
LRWAIVMPKMPWPAALSRTRIEVERGLERGGLLVREDRLEEQFGRWARGLSDGMGTLDGIGKTGSLAGHT